MQSVREPTQSRGLQQASILDLILLKKNILKKCNVSNLSIVGKVCIIKTFNFTACVYHQTLVVPDSVLTQMNRLLFRFLWRKKDCNRKAFEKVKKNVECSDLENGGLGMLDLTLSTHLLDYIDIYCRQPRALSSVAWGHLNLA